MNKDNNLDIQRHSLAHVLALAVKRLWPKAKLGIGPAIDNGFYYDFDFGQTKISDTDLVKIEEEMKKIISEKLAFDHQQLSIADARELLTKNKEDYKLELLNDLAEQGETEVGFYQTGEFIDLCRGPHVVDTSELDSEAFKLDRLAGAYWRGSENNKMLTRIYGLAFETKKDLDDYQEIMAQALDRDHRKLGRELDLFHIDEVVGAGLPLWHPKGAKLWRLIEEFWYKEHEKAGYELVRTPHIGNKALWETSGHWGFYNNSMYPPMEAGQSLLESQNKEQVKESEAYLLKPMNCPFHVRIYKNTPKSYRDLPVRWAECGTVYRFEKKGELSGLTRVRGFTQDDAHIICSADQVENELGRVIDFIMFIYQSFGFKDSDIQAYLSVRDPENSKYAGSDEGWNFTEKVLEKVATAKGLSFQKDIGGAVFYGPKLDFKIKDALGREWQCSTLQFDFNLPERFKMDFVNNQGQKEQPYMLHRALFGSFERFIGLLIEHYAGAFPVWLSPVQVKILSVGEKHFEFCQQLADELKASDLRVEVDVSDEMVGGKTRKAIAEKVPYILVVGDKEIASGDLSVRMRGEKALVSMSKSEFVEMVLGKVKERN